MVWGTIGTTEQIDGASGHPWTLRFERRLAPRESAKITNAASSVWLVRDVSSEGRGLLYAAKRQNLASLAEVDALVDEAAAWRAACLADDTDPSRKIITELHDVFVERDGTPPYTVTFIAEFCSRGFLPRGHARLSEPVLLTLVSDLAMVARVMPSPHAHIAYESLLVDSKGRVRVGGFGAHRSAILRDNPGMTNRDDVFDIGLLLYELIFGQLPPENDLTVPRDSSQVPYSPALLDLVEIALNQSTPTELYDAALRAGAHPLTPVINVDASTAATHDGALQADAPEHVARATERNIDRLVEGIDIAPAFNALLADLEADGGAVSNSVFKSLFRKPISKDALSAMRALTMIHNLLLDGPETMLASVRKNDKFMSWTETSWTGEAVNAKCNENSDGLDGEALNRLRCFQGGEISFYAALLRRKATFHQLAAGGFTGRWGRTGAINPQTQRDVLETRRRKVIQGMADVVEMASELGCRFAAAQDTEAPSKHAALGAMVSECCLAYNAALELAMQVASVQDAEKLAPGIARLYAAARALVFAVERVPSAGGESWVVQFSAEAPPDIVSDFEMRQRMTMGGDNGAEEADFPKAGWEEGVDVANQEDEKKKKKKTKKKSDKNKADGDDIKAEDGALVVHGADEEAKQSVATMFGDLLSIDESQNAAKEQSEAPRPLPNMSNAQALASAFGVPEEAVEDQRPAYEYGEHDNYDDEDEAGGYEDYQARKQYTAPPRDSKAPSTGAWAARAGYGHQALVTAASVAKKRPVYYQCALSEVEQAAELEQSQAQAYSADYGNDGNVGHDTLANEGRSRDVDGRRYEEQERAYQEKQQNYGRYDSNPDSLEDDGSPDNNAGSQPGRRPQQRQQYDEDDYDSYESVEYDVQQEDVIAEDQPAYKNGHGGATAARSAAPPPSRTDYQNSRASTAPTTQRSSPKEFTIDSKRALLLRKLRLGDKISDGDKLQVYKGEYNREDAVIKKLTKKGMSDEEVVRDLRNEIMVMCTLNHENVMKCVAGSLKKPDFVLVMSHLKRGSLFEVLYKTRIQLTSAMIKKMMMQIASGMANMHANGFIHRDLKSLNILVDSSYNIKIGDFGCTRHVSEASSDIGKGLIGTYQYMAPEVLSGQPHSFKSDVFAFAIVLCEMVSGTPPFHGMDPRSVAEKVVQDNVRPVIPMSCPRPYIELIQKCWSPVPMRRPSFEQVVETLKTIK